MAVPCNAVQCVAVRCSATFSFLSTFDGMLGCNNGGGGGNFSKVKRLVAKSIGTQKRLFSGFFVAREGFQKRRIFFPRHILHINPTMPVCPWALRICKNVGIRTYFGLETVESVKVFRHFAFWRHGTRLATIFLAGMPAVPGVQFLF